MATATKKLRSIKGRRVRVTRVDECGVPIIGAASTVVTSGFITVTIGAEYEPGDEYIQKNAWGDLWINDADVDVLKYCPVTVQFAEVDPDVADIMSAGVAPIVVDIDGVSTTIGFGVGPSSYGGNYAIEVWTKRTGGDACASGQGQEWGYFLLPFIKNGKIDGDLTVENAPLNITLTGKAYLTPHDWGIGPYGDNPLLAPHDMQNIYELVTTTIAPPSDTATAGILANITAIRPGDRFPTNPRIDPTTGFVPGELTLLGYGPYDDAMESWEIGQYFQIGTTLFSWHDNAWQAGPVLDPLRPINTVVPRMGSTQLIADGAGISGANAITVGDTLYGNNGTWSNTPTFVRVWESAPTSTGPWTVRATAATYTVPAGNDQWYRLRVTGTNANGVAVAYSVAAST
jgi:hypothetical protein